MLFKKIILVTAALVVMVYIFGTTIPKGNCSRIGECKQCWETEPVNLTSELCANARVCTATAAQQQHNAVVDVLLCACAKAKEKEYTDAALNKDIESVLSALTDDKTITAKQVCDSGFLTKRQYG